MYISDRNALKYGSGLILILLPLLASAFNYWSWIVEVLLLLSVFYFNRFNGIRFTVIFLALGYLSSFFILGIAASWQIGYTPWAGILLITLKNKGFNTADSVFWSLMAAAILSAWPIIPNLSEILTQENLDKTVDSAMEFYQQQGSLSMLEEQGISEQDFEKYFRLALPVYFKLLPGIAGIMAILVLGVSYLMFRLSLKKVYKLRSVAYWRFPWYAIWVAIAGIAAYLGGDYIKNEGLTVLGMNMMLIISVICLVQGFSCLYYLIKRPKTPRYLVVILIICAFFLSHVILAGLVFAGLFDLVLNFRQIPEKIEEGQ